MAERFEKLFVLPENLYIEGSPVLICAGALLKDTVTGRMLVQLKLKNIGTGIIIAVKVKIRAYEPNGEEVDGIEEYQYLDLNVNHAEEFAQKTPIYLPNNSTRRFEVGIIEVVQSGSDTWASDYVTWTPLVEQKPISALHDKELAKQYSIEVGGEMDSKFNPDYIPDEPLDLFRCTCGGINPKTSEVCLYCGRKKEDVFKALDHDLLKQKIDIRLEEEKQKEQKRLEYEKKEKLKKAKIKRFKRLTILTGIILVLTSILIALFTFIIPNIKYSIAADLYRKGKYDEAFNVYSEIVDYKDAKEKRDKSAYKNASILLKNGEYKKAKEIFRVIDTMDSDIINRKILICDCYIAKQELKKGNIKTYKKIISDVLINNIWTIGRSNYKNRITFEKDGSINGSGINTIGNKWSITKSGKICLKDSTSLRDSDLYTVKCNADILDNKFSDNKFSIILMDSSDYGSFYLYGEK